MKKYFIAETDEELVFGDIIELDLNKKTKHGQHTIESEIKFSELSLPLLLEIGAIEEREVEEEEDNTPEDDLLDFGEDCPFKGMLDAVVEDQEALEKRVDKLEENFGDIFNEIATLENKMKEFKEWQAGFLARYYVDKATEKKTPSSKKK